MRRTMISKNYKPSKEAETLIIKAKLVKTLRSKVNVDKLNVKVKSIQKIIKGDLKVRISGEQRKAT